MNIKHKYFSLLKNIILHKVSWELEIKNFILTQIILVGSTWMD